MEIFINSLKTALLVLSFVGHKTVCSVQKAVPKQVQSVAGQVTQAVQKAAAPGAKKEIFIAGLKAEDLKGRSADDIVWDSKRYAIDAVEEALLELYGKEMQAQGKPLPTLAKHQQELGAKLKECDEGGPGGVLAGHIAGAVATEKLNKLSPADIKSYYEKIKSNPRAYQLYYGWDGHIPPYSDGLVEGIKATLFLTWDDEAKKDLYKQPVANLKAHPLYKKIVAACKEEFEIGRFHHSNPYVAALKDTLKEEATQKVRAMTTEERQKHDKEVKEQLAGRPFATETHVLEGIVYEKLMNDILQKMATEYTVKSDSPYILEAVKKAQNRTLLNATIS